jgi:hypothetical protein
VCGGRRRRSDFTVRLEATGPIGLRILYLMHDNAYSGSYSCWVLCGGRGGKKRKGEAGAEKEKEEGRGKREELGFLRT